MRGAPPQRPDGVPTCDRHRPSNVAVCPTCPHHCRLEAGEVGRCRARANVGGRVACTGYSRVTSLALDPVEKKPLARWMPGRLVVSVGGYGCNMDCPFCQNAYIAAAGADEVPWRELGPDELVALTRRARERDPRVCGVAFTYNEPLVAWEYVRDCARLAHEDGLACVLVSNGMACAPVIRELRGLIDAANIDLKGCGQAFYDACGGDYECVRATIAALADDPACHLEVTTLVVPGMNDRDEDVDELAAWLAGVDPDITYHLTRFFPCHRMSESTGARPTRVQTVYHMANVARRHLPHVRTGNC